MMNDERAIYLLKSILPKKVSYAQMICASNCYGDEMVYQEPEPYAVEYAIKTIEESSKLKIENKKLKENQNYFSKVNGRLVRIIDKQDREIAKLKNELEQIEDTKEKQVSNQEAIEKAAMYDGLCK